MSEFASVYALAVGVNTVNVPARLPDHCTAGEKWPPKLSNRAADTLAVGYLYAYAAKTMLGHTWSINTFTGGLYHLKYFM
jgi:hypothetical protein